MKNLENFGTPLDSNELKSICGGDRFTEAFFGWLGSMAAVIANANEHDQQTGVHGHI